MLGNMGSSSGWCAKEPSLGKAAPGSCVQSTQATGPMGAGSYFFKDRGHCSRLEREISWMLSAKGKSTKLEFLNA